MQPKYTHDMHVCSRDVKQWHTAQTHVLDWGEGDREEVVIIYSVWLYSQKLENLRNVNELKS